MGSLVRHIVILTRLGLLELLGGLLCSGTARGIPLLRRRGRILMKSGRGFRPELLLEELMEPRRDIGSEDASPPLFGPCRQLLSGIDRR